MKTTLLKILLTSVVALVLAFVPKSATARRGAGSHGGGGSRGGGGSHGGNSHGGGSFHGGGHSSFRGGGQSYRGSRGGAAMSSTGLGGGHMNMGRINRGSYARSGGFSSTSGNFARSSGFGRGNFGSSVNHRNFGYSGASQPAERGSRSAMGGWQSFGNSAFRSTPGLARTSGNAMGGRWQSFGNSGFRSTPEFARTSVNAAGGGWRSFGNSSGGGRAGISRGYVNNVRADGQWHSFGNSRNESLGRNVSGFSFARTSRGYAPDRDASRWGFRSNRFSSSTPAMSRFSSFSTGRSRGEFGSDRFGSTDFASSGFGSAGLGGSDFSNSLLGSSLSLIPNLLFGGLLRFGTPLFGGGGLLEGGLLAGNAISLAARWLGSGLGSNGFDQGGPAGFDNGFGPGGFGVSFGFTPAPAWPACNAVASFQGPGWGWSGYCGPSPYYPSRWNGISLFGDRKTNYNTVGDHFGNSDFHADPN
jgi:hypothetical protein